jgi:hypothetical protein
MRAVVIAQDDSDYDDGDEGFLEVLPRRRKGPKFPTQKDKDKGRLFEWTTTMQAQDVEEEPGVLATRNRYHDNAPKMMILQRQENTLPVTSEAALAYENDYDELCERLNAMTQEEQQRLETILARQSLSQEFDQEEGRIERLDEENNTMDDDEYWRAAIRKVESEDSETRNNEQEDFDANLKTMRQ